MIDKAILWKSKTNIKAKLMLMLPFFSVSGSNGQPLSTEEVGLAIIEGYSTCRMSQGTCLYGTHDKKRFYVPCWRYFR